MPRIGIVISWKHLKISPFSITIIMLFIQLLCPPNVHFLLSASEFAQTYKIEAKLQASLRIHNKASAWSYKQQGKTTKNWQMKDGMWKEELNSVRRKEQTDKLSSLFTGENLSTILISTNILIFRFLIIGFSWMI